MGMRLRLSCSDCILNQIMDYDSCEFFWTFWAHEQQRNIQLICVLLHIVSLMLLYFLPESPRWLILNNKTKKAEKIIREACHYNNSRLPSDLGLVRHAEKKKWMRHNEKPSYFHLFRSSELRFRNIVLFIVWVRWKNVVSGWNKEFSDSNGSSLLWYGHCSFRSVIPRKV